MTTDQHRRTGRPQKNPHEKRSAQRKIRLTLAEDEYVIQQAARARLSISEYIRQCALKVAIKPPRGQIDEHAALELNRIGVNINQIARALNRGQGTPFYIEEAFTQLSQALELIVKSYDP